MSTKQNIIVYSLNKAKGLDQVKKIIESEGLVVLSKNMGNGTIETNAGRFKVVHPDVRALGLKPSAVYVDSDIPYETFQNFVEPALIINQPPMIYF